MCLTSRSGVYIPEVSAFKIFTRDEDGLLQSAFSPKFKQGLKYPPNERIRVDVEESNFFAFENMNNAIHIARQGHRKWRMVKGELIVLPVTLYDVVFKGSYFVSSDDPQCLDSYYPAYESKELTVHDSKETRNQFYDVVIKHWYNLGQFGMSNIDKEALFARFPDLAPLVGAA
jgi:hypothetical protein